MCPATHRIYRDPLFSYGLPIQEDVWDCNRWAVGGRRRTRGKLIFPRGARCVSIRWWPSDSNKKWKIEDWEIGRLGDWKIVVGVKNADFQNPAVCHQINLPTPQV